MSEITPAAAPPPRFAPPNADAATWHARLPRRIARYARRWSLDVAPPFPDLSYAYVAPAARADGSAAVLKLAVPDAELTSQVAALRAYAGRGSVRLLRADAARGALLLERLRPGTPLTALAADDPLEATRVAARVMRRLWRPPPTGARAFPTVAQWAAGLARLRRAHAGGTGPLPADLVETAEAWFARLVPSMAAPVLLHGDLHPGNILRATREPWLAIDPKGVVGEPAYEVGALLRNLTPAELASPRPTAPSRSAPTCWPPSSAWTAGGCSAGAWRKPCSPRGGASRMGARTPSATGSCGARRRSWGRRATAHASTEPTPRAGTSTNNALSAIPTSAANTIAGIPSGNAHGIVTGK